MSGGREALEVDADLGDDDFGDAPANARNAVEQGHLLLPLPQKGGKRADALRDLRAHASYELLEKIDVRELLGHQEALMRLELPHQRLLQGGNLLAQTSAGERR